MTPKPLSLAETKVALNSKKPALNNWIRTAKTKLLYTDSTKTSLNLAFEADIKTLFGVTTASTDIDLFPYRIDIKTTTATEDKDKLNISISSPHTKAPTYLKFEDNQISRISFYMILGCFKAKNKGWQLIEVLILRPETLNLIHWTLYSGGKISAKLGNVRQISKDMFWKK